MKGKGEMNVVDVIFLGTGLSCSRVRFCQVAGELENHLSSVCLLRLS